MTTDEKRAYLRFGWAFLAGLAATFVIGSLITGSFVHWMLAYVSTIAFVLASASLSAFGGK